jgi:hypothetical protein
LQYIIGMGLSRYVFSCDLKKVTAIVEFKSKRILTQPNMQLFSTTALPLGGI